MRQKSFEKDNMLLWDHPEDGTCYEVNYTVRGAVYGSNSNSWDSDWDYYGSVEIDDFDIKVFLDGKLVVDDDLYDMITESDSFNTDMDYVLRSL